MSTLRLTCMCGKCSAWAAERKLAATPVCVQRKAPASSRRRLHGVASSLQIVALKKAPRPDISEEVIWSLSWWRITYTCSFIKVKTLGIYIHYLLGLDHCVRNRFRFGFGLGCGWLWTPGYGFHIVDSLLWKSKASLRKSKVFDQRLLISRIFLKMGGSLGVSRALWGSMGAPKRL